MSVHYSSESVEWSTPQDLFDRLNRAFRFTVDVCATDENAKVPLYYTKERDGLKYEWFGNCWMNPPYGREIGNWVAKALVSARQKRRDCGLLAALPEPIRNGGITIVPTAKSHSLKGG